MYAELRAPSLIKTVSSMNITYISKYIVDRYSGFKLCVTMWINHKCHYEVLFVINL
jgi:hypothetical protein